MVSVNKVTSIDFGKSQQLQFRAQNNKVVQLNANDPNLLVNFLSLTGAQNRAAIAFKGQIPLYLATVNVNGREVWAGRPTIDDKTQNKIQSEAARRINGEFQWPKIDKADAWMISAETANFMFVGGLAKVAIDLPNSLNASKRHKGHKMTVVTPMYLDNNTNTLTENKETGKFTYKSDKGSIEVKKAATINVPAYDNWKSGNLIETKVEIYKGSLPADANNPKGPKTEYIFFHTPDKDGNEFNANYFNITPAHDNNPDAKGCYAKSTSGIDELNRFAFFSRAVYELMKEAKEGKISTIKPPNVALLNDWHAGGIAPLMHYLAPVEKSYGRISNELNDYFENMPTLSIVHNLEHQGGTNDGNKITQITATLFGAFGVDIIANAHAWSHAGDSDKNSLFKSDSYNSAKNGLSLVDRVVPVSENYAEELIHSEDKANYLMDLVKARKFASTPTLTPITNGYTKATIAPTKNHMKDLTSGIKNDFNMAKVESDKPPVQFYEKELRINPLLHFDKGELENKKENKNIIIDVLKQIIEREREIQGKPLHTLSKAEQKRKYILHDPFNTVLPDTKDFSNTPLLTFIGRIDKQKGLDYILKDSLKRVAKDILAYKGSNKTMPIIVIGGPVSSKESYEKVMDLKREVTEINPDFGKQILIFNGFVKTDLIASAADMFFVPSVFEPCGLTQIEAMAKGALPIVTATGGLVNTVRDEVDGFMTQEFYDQRDGDTKGRIYPSNDSPQKFHNGDGIGANAAAYAEATHRALNKFYQNHGEFEEMQKAAIENDFSWDKEGGALDKYINLMCTGNLAG